MSRILFYNWDPLAGPAGGGVTAYLTELISCLLQSTDDEIWFLNSGRKYTPDGIIRLEQQMTVFGDRVTAYEIVNSPVLAPGNQSIFNIRKYLEDESIYALFVELIEKAQGFDLIHYHNLEGLSLKVLTLKEHYPKIKYIYTFHNYFPICTQVNLWQEESRNCHTTDFSKCVNCYQKANYDLTRFRFEHLEIPKLKEIFLEYSMVHPDVDDWKLYKQFREKNAAYLNQYMDMLIAVSERTKEVLEQAGLCKEKLKVLYAGSEIAGHQKKPFLKKVKNECFSIVYLGYWRKEKGFYFFLECLEKMERKLAKQINVTIVGRHNDRQEKELEQITNLKDKFHEITVYNGFCDYEELEQILACQNLGILPTLWEDNLPRVAMEMFAFGLPVLTSNLGGASELGGKNKHFIFEAGNHGDFLSKLREIMDNRQYLSEYWVGAGNLKTIPEHIRELQEIYNCDRQ